MIAEQIAQSPQEGQALNKRSIEKSPCGLMTIAWIWVLRRSDLGEIYPLMGLAFVLVLASHLIFGESFTWRYAPDACCS